MQNMQLLNSSSHQWTKWSKYSGTAQLSAPNRAMQELPESIRDPLNKYILGQSEALSTSISSAVKALPYRQD